MTMQIAHKFWIEYRNRENLVGIGERARGSIRKSDGSQFHKKMKDVIEDDFIIHLAEDNDGNKSFIGYSRARKDVSKTRVNYVVQLKDFTRFPNPIGYNDIADRHKRAILKIISERPHYQPFQLTKDRRRFRVPEGYYFGPALQRLVDELLVSTVFDLKDEKIDTETPNNKGGISKGPTKGGTRSNAVWVAKHSPLVRDIVEYLEMLGLRGIGNVHWQPDILMENRDVKVLIEVKPQATTYNIITAIGQIICYRSPFKKIISIIAAKSELDNENLTKILKDQSINYLDVSRKWRPDLRKLIGE